MKFNIEEFNK